MPFEHSFRLVEVKVTLEGHINEIFLAITPTYIHGF